MYKTVVIDITNSNGTNQIPVLNINLLASVHTKMKILQLQNLPSQKLLITTAPHRDYGIQQIYKYTAKNSTIMTIQEITPSDHQKYCYPKTVLLRPEFTLLPKLLVNKGELS